MPLQRSNIGMANALTLESLDKKLDKTIEDLSEIISQFAQSTHEEFVGIRGDIADLKASHDKLEPDHEAAEYSKTGASLEDVSFS